VKEKEDVRSKQMTVGWKNKRDEKGRKEINV
jgi:hypothetical protein